MRDPLEDRHGPFDVADLELVRRSQEGFLQLPCATQCDDPTAMDERVSIDDRLALEEVVARGQDGPPPGRPLPESGEQPDSHAHRQVPKRRGTPKEPGGVADDAAPR